MEASWKVQKIENQKLLPRRGDWFAHVLKTQGVALGWEQVAPLGRRCFRRVSFRHYCPGRPLLIQIGIVFRPELNDSY